MKDERVSEPGLGDATSKSGLMRDSDVRAMQIDDVKCSGLVHGQCSTVTKNQGPDA